MACEQADAGERQGQSAQRGGMHAAHNANALRGEALRQSDVISDLKGRLRNTEVTMLSCKTLGIAKQVSCLVAHFLSPSQDF